MVGVVVSLLHVELFAVPDQVGDGAVAKLDPGDHVAVHVHDDEDALGRSDVHLRLRVDGVIASAVQGGRTCIVVLYTARTLKYLYRRIYIVHVLFDVRNMLSL